MGEYEGTLQYRHMYIYTPRVESADSVKQRLEETAT